MEYGNYRAFLLLWYFPSAPDKGGKPLELQGDSQFLLKSNFEGFNVCGERGYDDFVSDEVTKTARSGDETTRSPTWSASFPQIHRI